jgi:ankyrin repeat protein
MAAAAAGRLGLLRLLLARGAAVDAADPATGCTAFHMACYSNQAECAEALARVGCDVGLKTKEGRTGRQLAEIKGHDAVVAQLLVVIAERVVAAGLDEGLPSLFLLILVLYGESLWLKNSSDE